MSRKYVEIKIPEKDIEKIIEYKVNDYFSSTGMLEYFRSKIKNYMADIKKELKNSHKKIEALTKEIKILKKDIENERRLDD